MCEGTCWVHSYMNQISSGCPDWPGYQTLQKKEKVGRVRCSLARNGESTFLRLIVQKAVQTEYKAVGPVSGPVLYMHPLPSGQIFPRCCCDGCQRTPFLTWGTHIHTHTLSLSHTEARAHSRQSVSRRVIQWPILSTRLVRGSASALPWRERGQVVTPVHGLTRQEGKKQMRCPLPKGLARRYWILAQDNGLGAKKPHTHTHTHTHIT